MRKSTRILALVWVLALLASPLYAGHSFSDPMYTTGDGDLYVLGGLDVDGTCRLDGAFTFNAGATGDNLTLSGTLAVGGAFSLTDSLYVTGNVVLGDSLYVTDDLTVGDDFKVAGEFEGSRCLLAFGSQVTDQTADKNLKGAGGWSFDADNGYCMHRAGSIVGVTMNYNIDSYSDTPTMECEVNVGASVVYSVSETVDGTGARSIYGNQARGTDTFSAGDIIWTRVDITGTIQYDYPGGYIEVVFDD